VLLYIERWLKAPVQLEDGSLIHRDKGTPQGGVISPLLANLFLHYAFDTWMQRQYPRIPFERYADDGICHCRSKAAKSIHDTIRRLKMHRQSNLFAHWQLSQVSVNGENNSLLAASGETVTS
jgi:retron-type reverse transcriptase